MAKLHTHSRQGDGMIWWVPADPTQKPELKATSFTLDSLSSFVGGYIEIVRGPRLPMLDCGCRTVMVVDEEGLLKDKAVNAFGSLLYTGPTPIVGDIFLVGEGPVGEDAEPDFFGLPASMHSWVQLVESLGAR